MGMTKFAATTCALVCVVAGVAGQSPFAGRWNLSGTGETLLVAGNAVSGTARVQQKPPPKATPAAAVKAQDNYRMTCQPCHGPAGKGVLPGTDLTSGTWKHGSTVPAIAKVIADGVPGTAMLPAKDRFTKAEILELAKLARSFDKTPRRKPPVKK